MNFGSCQILAPLRYIATTAIKSNDLYHEIVFLLILLQLHQLFNVAHNMRMNVQKDKNMDHVLKVTLI